mmetsp:Transcript_44544/g.65292  ORF Transcript_44544/g.65292 Transcript_44544/m.65292 type:complete len:186 (+) Transcript_44544:1297-1854(+)
MGGRADCSAKACHFRPSLSLVVHLCFVCAPSWALAPYISTRTCILTCTQILHESTCKNQPPGFSWILAINIHLYISDTHIYTYAKTHAHTHTNTHTHTHKYIYLYMHIDQYVMMHISAYMLLCTYMYAQTDTCTYRLSLMMRDNGGNTSKSMQKLFLATKMRTTKDVHVTSGMNVYVMDNKNKNY